MPNSKENKKTNRFFIFKVIKLTILFSISIKLWIEPDVLYINSGLKVITPYIKYE
jgi:hypothetical protein